MFLFTSFFLKEYIQELPSKNLKKTLSHVNKIEFIRIDAIDLNHIKLEKSH